MRQRIVQIMEWKSRLLIDGVLSVVEALWVLVISSLYLLVLSFNHGLNTEGVGLIESLKYTVSSTLHPTETIIYITGILSSSTAYFVVRFNACGRHIKRVGLLLSATAVLFWIATPLFMAGLPGEPANEAFAAGVATVLAVAAIAVWLYSLFSQRRIFERQASIDGDRRGHEITRNVGELP